MSREMALTGILLFPQPQIGSRSTLPTTRKLGYMKRVYEISAKIKWTKKKSENSEKLKKNVKKIFRKILENVSENLWPIIDYKLKSIIHIKFFIHVHVFLFFIIKFSTKNLKVKSYY